MPCSVDLVVGTLGVLPTTAEARALDKLLVAGLRLIDADRPLENDDRLLGDRPLSSLMKVAYTTSINSHEGGSFLSQEQLIR